MHLSHAPPRIREANPTVDVPFALEQVVLQALEKHRENRFASATAFLQALEDSEAVVEPAAAAGDRRDVAAHRSTHAMAASAGRATPGPAGAPAARAVRWPRRRWWSRSRRWAWSAYRIRAHHRGAAAALTSAPSEPAPRGAGAGDRAQEGRVAARGRQHRGGAARARGAAGEAAARTRACTTCSGRVAFSDNRHADGLASYRAGDRRSTPGSAATRCCWRTSTPRWASRGTRRRRWT